MRQTPRPGWHQSLAVWAAQRYGAPSEGTFRRSPRRGLPFAPFEAHRPERFHARPVALLVLSQDAEVDPSAVADAVELVRISTNGFRAVAFTDSYGVSMRLRPEWPVEQTLPEEAWLAHARSRPPENWLDSATEQLEWAVEHYGAEHVLAPRNSAEAAEAVTVLAHAYNAQPPVLRAALEGLSEAEAPGSGHRAADEQEAPEQIGFRFGWDELERGEHHRRFRGEGGSWVAARVTVGARTESGAVAGTLVGTEETASPALLQAAHEAGWSSVLLHPEGTGSARGEAFTAGVLRACLDALPVGGAVVVLGGDEPWGLRRDEREAELRPLRDGRWTLELSDVAVLRFTEAEAVEVFRQVSRVLAL